MNTNQQGTRIRCTCWTRPVLPMRGRNPRLNICIAFCLLHACGAFCLACIALVLCALHTFSVCVMQCIRFHLAFAAAVVAVARPALAHLSQWLPSACCRLTVVCSVVHGVNILPCISKYQTFQALFLYLESF